MSPTAIDLRITLKPTMLLAKCFFQNEQYEAAYNYFTQGCESGRLSAIREIFLSTAVEYSDGGNEDMASRIFRILTKQ